MSYDTGMSFALWYCQSGMAVSHVQEVKCGRQPRTEQELLITQYATRNGQGISMNNWTLLMAVAVVTFVSQWLGMQWFDGPQDNQPTHNSAILADQKKLQQRLEQIGHQLDRIEEWQFAEIASVDPDSNTLTIDGNLLKDTLTAVVKEELGRISPRLVDQLDVMDKRPAIVTEEEKVARQEAFVQSTDIIWDAIAQGEWLNDHTRRMQPLVSRLSDDQRIELLEQFHSAIGRGDIDLNGHFPPL